MDGLTPDTQNPQDQGQPGELDPQFQQLLEQSAGEIDAQRTQQVQQQNSQEGILSTLSRVTGDAAGSGAAAAMYNVKDMLFGRTNYADKSDFRKADEASIADIRRGGTLPSLVQGVGQFVTGLAVAPEVAPEAELGTLAAKGLQTLRGAAIGAAVFDPHQDRLSNLVQQFPSLQNPVTAFLAAKPDDTEAEGRLKNALEGIGMDVALSAAFALGAKAIKLRAAGDAAGAKAASDEAAKVMDKAQAKGDAEAQPSSVPLEETQKKFADGPDAPPAATAEAPKVETADDAWAKVRTMAEGKESEPSIKSAPVNEPDATITQGKPGPEDAQVGRGPRKPYIQEGAVQKIIDATNFSKDDAGIATATGVPQGGFVNWTKIAGPDDVAAYTDKLTRALKPTIAPDAMSDARVGQMMQARATAFNEDPMALIDMLRREGANAPQLAANMEAAYRVSNALFQDTYQLASKIKMGLLQDFGGDASKATAELVRRVSIAADVMSQAKAMTATAGRTMRRMRAEFKITPEMVDALKKDGSSLVDAIYNSNGDANLIDHALNPSTWERLSRLGTRTFTTLITNGPLWWYPTHVVNAVSNVLLLAQRPTEKVLGSLLMDSWDKLTGAQPVGEAVRRQALKEYRTSVSAITDGWNAAKDAFMAGDGALNPHEGYFNEAGQNTNSLTSFRPINTIEDIIHNGIMSSKVAVSMPTRFLGAADEMVKTIRYRAVVQAKAAMEAEDQNLVGDAAEQYIRQRMNGAFDELGRGNDVEALREALETTLTAPLQEGTLGAGIQYLVNNVPIMRAVFTYVKTPINALRYGVRLTPGLQFAQKQFRQMLVSSDPTIRSQAFGQMAMGALWMGAVAPFVMSGKVTGGGPSDPQLRAQLTANGWKPYSYVWDHGDGSKTYVPLGRLDPPGLLIGLMADAWDLHQYPERLQSGQDILNAAAVALISNIGNKAYLTSLHNTVQALSDPEKSAMKYLGNTGNTLVPGSSLIRGLNPDPYQREARTMADYILKDIPGWGTGLEPRYDALGQPMTVQKGLWSTESPQDNVHNELQRIMLQTGKGLVPADPQKVGIDLRDYKLASGRSAYAQMNEYIAKPKTGAPLADTLNNLISSDLYKTLPDGDSGTKGTKLWAIGNKLQTYRDAAYKRVLIENKDLSATLAQKQRETMAQHKQLSDQLKQQKANPVDQALQSLGVQPYQQ